MLCTSRTIFSYSSPLIMCRDWIATSWYPCSASFCRACSGVSIWMPSRCCSLRIIIPEVKARKQRAVRAAGGQIALAGGDVLLAGVVIAGAKAHHQKCFFSYPVPQVADSQRVSRAVKSAWLCSSSSPVTSGAGRVMTMQGIPASRQGCTFS